MNRMLLKDILNDLNVNLLKELVGIEKISFFQKNYKVSDDFYKHTSESETMVNALINSDVLSIFKDVGLRNKIIDRISKKNIAFIFSQITGDTFLVSDVNSSFYETLKRECKNKDFFEHFLTLLEINTKPNHNSETSDASITEVQPQYGLYDYQKEIANKVFSSIENGDNRRAVIHLPTGAGKTRTAMHLVCRHLLTTKDPIVLWLANSDLLLDQASEEFDKAWSNLGNHKVLKGRFYNKFNLSLEAVNSGVIIAGLQKLHSYYSDENPSRYLNFMKKITLVVFDEAHMAAATTYKELVLRFMDNSPKAKLIGLTATPGRVYEQEKFEHSVENLNLSALFDNNKITMDVAPEEPMEYLINRGYLANPEFISLNYYDIDLYESFQDVKLTETEVLSRLSQSKNRNKVVLDTVLKEIQNHSKVIVFACDIQHARNLAFSLCCLGVKAASIDSKNSHNKHQLVDRYRNGDIDVLVNCEMLTTGFDAPETNVAVIARPTESLVLYLQMIGRALRGNKDQSRKDAKIYTVIDEISEFNNINISFKHWNSMWTEVEQQE